MAVGTRRVVGAPSRNAALTRLLAGFGVWVATDWALLVALSVVAYRVAGASAVGLVGAARVLPGAVVAPLVSVGADRLPRAKVLAATHGCMAAVSVALAVTSAHGTSLTALLLVVAAGSMLSAAFKPCTNALVPQVVASPEQLVAANAAYGSVEAGATVAGPVLSGVLVATVRPDVTFLVVAALYVLGAVASSTIRTQFQPARARSRTGAQALLEPLRGFPLLATRPGVRVAFWLIMGQTGMRGLLNVLAIVLAQRVDATVAGLFAAVGAGGLVGARIAARLGGDDAAARRTGLGVATWGACVLVIGGWPVAGVAWTALVVLGLGNAVEDAYGYSLINRLVPDDLAGRAWGAFHTIGALTLAAGSLLAPALVASVGLRWTMVVCGAALAVAVLACWPRLRALDATVAVPSDTLDLLRGVPALAPMPPLALERMARSATTEDIPDGTVVIAEGQPGDRFYVVADGTARVEQGGREIRMLGPGESFGEIALLHGVPRTATVVSAGPLRVVTVDLDAFVGAVTGHRDTYRAAEDTARALLAADGLR